MSSDAPEPATELLAAVDAAGYGPRDPVVVAVDASAAPRVHLSRGRTATGGMVGLDTVVYAASLSKQVTAACAAVLVRRGTLDVDHHLRRWLPELPSWADRVEVGDLVHHTSGLPDVLSFDELRERGHDRTSDDVLRALAEVRRLQEPPGTAHRYCNAGYVVLAAVIERVAGQPLADVAAECLFSPLGMDRTRFWTGPGPRPAGAAPTEAGMPAALSVGDGGMWSTASDLLRWNQALDHDELGVTARLSTPGRLRDGTVLDYAWGIGVRVRAGQRVYRHGGLWAGVSAQLVRVPGRGSAMVLALDRDGDRTTALADALLAHLTA